MMIITWLSRCYRSKTWRNYERKSEV